MDDSFDFNSELDADERKFYFKFTHHIPSRYFEVC